MEDQTITLNAKLGSVAKNLRWLALVYDWWIIALKASAHPITREKLWDSTNSKEVWATLKASSQVSKPITTKKRLKEVDDEATLLNIYEGN